MNIKDTVRIAELNELFESPAGRSRELLELYPVLMGPLGQIWAFSPAGNRAQSRQDRYRHHHGPWSWPNGPTTYREDGFGSYVKPLRDYYEQTPEEGPGGLSTHYVFCRGSLPKGKGRLLAVYLVNTKTSELRPFKWHEFILTERNNKYSRIIEGAKFYVSDPVWRELLKSHPRGVH